jgi:exosortase/archaeosortase family protein
VLRGVAVSLGLFGFLRLSAIEAQLVMPITRAQGRLAVELFGAPTLPVEATLACSGTDALALCLGAILAYPVRWRTRLIGAALGAALILGLNTVRIGTLGRAVVSPAWFNALHLYVWPAVLTLAIAGYVFSWMRAADGRQGLDARETVRHTSPYAARPQPSRRFVVLTVVFLLLFLAAAPLYLESSAVAALAAFIARAAAVALGGLGVSAHAAANVLWTPRGGFMVTQECISTPLVPVYLAGVCAYSTTRPQLAAGLLATLPLFIALGIARLLVVAVPEAIASPMFVVHAFYQVLLAALVVCLAARWRHDTSAAVGHAVAGVLVGALFVRLLGPFYTRLVTAQVGAPLDDPQGAIALLPGFQVGLYLALWIAAFITTGWRRFLAGLAMLALTQTAGLAALNALTAYSGLTAHVRDIRGWAIAGPLLIVAAVVNLARARR